MTEVPARIFRDGGSGQVKEWKMGAEIPPLSEQAARSVLMLPTQSHDAAVCDTITRGVATTLLAFSKWREDCHLL